MLHYANMEKEIRRGAGFKTVLKRCYMSKSKCVHEDSCLVFLIYRSAILTSCNFS